LFIARFPALTFRHGAIVVNLTQLGIIVLGAARTNPEGMAGLSPGFQPRVSIQKSIRPKGAAESVLITKNGERISEQTIFRPFRADRFLIRTRG
jgi:hypothetical protein